MAKRCSYFGLRYKGDAPRKRWEVENSIVQGAVNCQVGNGSCQEIQEQYGVVQPSHAGCQQTAFAFPSQNVYGALITSLNCWLEYTRVSSNMPSRRSQTRATKEREERKKRQEKFRKRTRSLFNKARLLARDTDAWVALIVRDRDGRVQSIRSSGSRYWPPSIQDVVAVAGDTNDAFLDHSETDSADEGVQETSIIPEKDPEPDSTMSIDQYEIDKYIENGRHLHQDRPREPVIQHSPTAEHSPVDPLRKSENTQLSQPMALDELSVDAREVQDTDATHITREPWNSAHSPGRDTVLDAGMADDTTFELGKLQDVIIETTEGSNDTTSDMAVESHNPTSPTYTNVNIVPGVPSEAIVTGNLSTAELDLPTSEYDILTDLDIPGAESRAQVDARESEASSAISTMTQHPNSPSSGNSGSWQVVNWPKMDPRDLLQSWNWVFQNRRHP
ncbi:hypothetical protein DL98DRAFT_543023 [Cadophora sp. DSE1049]|nr:hypothetical protein DL98DRAFT_543023 [Cadophora sp. DSE1049]